MLPINKSKMTIKRQASLALPICTFWQRCFTTTFWQSGSTVS